MSKDYYNILGISKDAPKEDIKMAYRKLAHEYHPDKKHGDEKKFKEINEAYQILSDDQKRAQYDQFGTSFDNRGFEGFGGGFGGGINFEDFDFGDIFSDIFGQRRTRQHKTKAQDILVDLELTLEDIYKGLQKDIKLQKMVRCTKCNGTGGEPGSSMKKCSTCKGQGEIRQTQRTFLGSFSRVTVCSDCQGEREKPEKTCARCRGGGAVRDIETITVNIPSGIDDGQIVKLEGQGQMGGKGELPGDLYIRIHLKKHKDFIKKGDDVYHDILISFTQATLGDKIEIPTLEGKIKLKIPAGIQSGKLIRIRGKGMSRVVGGRGDQFIEIQVETPKKLSQKAKDLLKKLKEEGL